MGVVAEGGGEGRGGRRPTPPHASMMSLAPPALEQEDYVDLNGSANQSLTLGPKQPERSPSPRATPSRPIAPPPTPPRPKKATSNSQEVSSVKRGLFSDSRGPETNDWAQETRGRGWDDSESSQNTSGRELNTSRAGWNTTGGRQVDTTGRTLDTSSTEWNTSGIGLDTSGTEMDAKPKGMDTARKWKNVSSNKVVLNTSRNGSDTRGSSLNTTATSMDNMDTSSQRMDRLETDAKDLERSVIGNNWRERLNSVPSFPLKNSSFTTHNSMRTRHEAGNLNRTSEDDELTCTSEQKETFKNQLGITLS